MRNHKFKTSKQDNRGSILRFICAFLAFALVFGTISAIVIFKHNDFSLRDLLAGETTTVSDTSESSSSSDIIKKEISGNTNFLIYCTDYDNTELYFLIIVRADMDNKTFKVYPLNTQTDLGGKTYIDYVAQGGGKSLVSAVEAQENVKIDKYISSTTDTFALAINYMDGLQFSVDNRIEYRTDDYTLILTQGPQTIKGETLLKYFRYCKTLGADGYKTQGLLVCAMLDNYINTENVDDGIKIYENILSKINSSSDISYVEASSGISALRVFCEDENRKPATVVLNLENVN